MSRSASETADGRPAALFLTTRWSVVLAAKDKSAVDCRPALEILCRDYWYPLYAYVRRSGKSPHDAQDLTQEFFARLLSKDWLMASAPDKGRFRTFLLVALKRFLANEWQRVIRLKRGGGMMHVPLDAVEAESRFAAEPALAADEVFERRWAMTVLEQSLTQLAAEFEEAGKSAEFEILQECLTSDRGQIPYERLAQRLGSTEGAVRVAVHRLRKRFRALFREHITQTVAANEDVDEEVRHLVGVLAKG
jgi:RNA polymerase sigma-70 factor (ECF subfamily)